MVTHTFNHSAREAGEADPCEFEAGLVYRVGMTRLGSETLCFNKQIITDFQRGTKVFKPWQLSNRTSSGAIIMKKLL